MVHEVRAGQYTVRGISVAGVYTSLQIPELRLVLDAGVPIRSFAATDRIFLSHTHSDHASALVALLGIRNLIGKGRLDLYAPAENTEALEQAIRAGAVLHHTTFDVKLHPMAPADTLPLGSGLFVRAFRTHHPAPSLGYAFIHRVSKLKPEHLGLPGQEIARRKAAGEALFDEIDRVEVAYATDTRASVFEAEPWLGQAKVLIVEATYVDDQRTVSEAAERGHLHVDELIQRSELLQNEHIVLMHFSQIYRPAAVHSALAARLPATLAARVVAFAPSEGDWFG